MKRKKRKVKVFRLLLVILLVLLIVGGIIYLVYLMNDKEEPVFNIDDLHINEIDYSESKELALDLYSKEYLLMRLNDFKVLYAKDIDKIIYPASLTKVLTMDAVLDVCENIEDTSSYSDYELDELIEANASLAGLKTNTEYTIKELLNALILPSGADAAECLSNYVEDKGYDLIDLMNKKCEELKLQNSHFTNPTGLHDDDLYTTLNDYSKIVIDTLLKSDAKHVLKTMEIEQDDKTYKSTLIALADRDDNIEVYGGKTGFTLEAGMNILVLYEVDNRSYMLILANAEGSPYKDGLHHEEDVNLIFDYLYNKK